MDFYKYITSPIFYPNDKPHLGTAYTLIICDFLKRFYEITNYKTFFVTGTDEHGKKIETAAKSRDLSCEEHVKEKREQFYSLKETLNLSFDKFVCTHSEHHIKAVQFLWNKVKSRGFIYKGFYTGWYSERDEQYFKESDLVDGMAPTGATVVQMKEECYFFSLSKFRDLLIDFYNKNPSFILPESRSRELLSTLMHGLDDLCISRSKWKLSWGVEVPEDPEHIIYVWFDALPNYISALSYPGDSFFSSEKQNFWKNSCHVLGKDILYFHGIIWPAILMAADLELPKQLIVHGWLTVEGQKMSKSLGNVLDPVELCKKYKSDYLRYFFLREVALSSDYDFRLAVLNQRITDEIADKIGNLINRVTTMITKYCNGRIPSGIKDEDLENSLDDKNLEEKMLDSVEKANFNQYTMNVLRFYIGLNKYLEDSSPWSKNLSERERNNILFNVSYFIKRINKFFYPICPEITKNIEEIFGFTKNVQEDIIDKEVKIMGVLVDKTQYL